MSNLTGDKPNAKARENSNFTSRKNHSGTTPPRIGGKFAKGDSRSKTMTAGLKNGSNRGGQY